MQDNFSTVTQLQVEKPLGFFVFILYELLWLVYCVW